MAITEADVRKVAGTTLDCSIFLTTAQTVYTNQLGDEGLDSAIADAITLYLAAHFAVLTTESGGLRRSKLSEADETYRIPGEKDVGLAFTRFGQQAMLLDPTGILAGLSANKGLRALFEVV